jgi:hypothetical protein
MRKLLALSLVSAVACGPQSFKDKSRDALPSKDAVAMGSPNSSQPTSLGGDQITQDSTAGQHSPFFDLTVSVAFAFNGGTALMLGIVEAVTNTEPTSCTETSCTWGPGSGPLDFNDYKLVVTQNGDAFDWELSGKDKAKPSSDFVVFMSGKAKPGPQPHHGSGSFLVDFDKAALLGGTHNETGQLNVKAYSNVGPAHLDVLVTGAKDTGDHPGTLNNLDYSYANDTIGGGDLDIAVHNTTSQDRFSVHSRWKNDGHGRADVAGLGSGYNVSLSECWGAAPFSVQFFSSNVKIVVPPFGGPDSGDASLCAYADAAFSTKTAP